MKLPVDCDVDYLEDYVSVRDSDELIDWITNNCDGLDHHDVVLADGSTHRVETGKWMFVDPQLTDHSLLHETHGSRRPWPSPIVPLRDRLERLTGVEFGVCVCIYYPDGRTGVGFHSDLPAFGPVSLIPSISLGAKRRFLLRHRDDPSDVIGLDLESGSLLIMGDGCQELLEHSLPLDSDCREPRINLTFRPFSWPTGIERGPR